MDDSDFERASQRKWYATKAGNLFYARSRDNKTRKTIDLHRFILEAFPGSIIDHKNRNGLDCRRSNLRFVTQQKNCQNRALSSRNISGFTGVSSYKGRWRAFICVNRKSILLGTFAKKEDAIAARKSGEIIYFGENNSHEISPKPPENIQPRPKRKRYKFIFKMANGYGYFVRINGRYVGYARLLKNAIRIRNAEFK